MFGKLSTEKLENWDTAGDYNKIVNAFEKSDDVDLIVPFIKKSFLSVLPHIISAISKSSKKKRELFVLLKEQKRYTDSIILQFIDQYKIFSTGIEKAEYKKAVLSAVDKILDGGGNIPESMMSYIKIRIKRIWNSSEMDERLADGSNSALSAFHKEIFYLHELFYICTELLLHFNVEDKTVDQFVRLMDYDYGFAMQTVSDLLWKRDSKSTSVAIQLIEKYSEYTAYLTTFYEKLKKRFRSAVTEKEWTEDSFEYRPVKGKLDYSEATLNQHFKPTRERATEYFKTVSSQVEDI